MKNKGPKKSSRIATKKVMASKSKISPKKTSRAKDQFSVYGQVQQFDGSVFADVLVRAVDKDMFGKENLLGETRTDNEGHFKIEYTEEHFRRTDKEKGGADLIVRVVDDKGTVLASSRKINSAKSDETVDVVVGNIQASALEHFIVRGVVTQDDKPLAGVVVNAYDKDVRREEWLGEAVTNATGNYEIAYRGESFTHAEKGPADLFVEVLNEDKKRLGVSAVVFNAASEQEINLALRSDENQKTEWEQLNDELFPLLKEQKQSDTKEAILYINLLPMELLPSDIQFLAKDTGRNEEQIRRWALAYKNEIKTDSIPAEAFYAWYQQGLPEELVRLWATGVEKLIEFLQEAITKNIITKKDDEWFNDLKQKINGLFIASKLDPAPEGEPASLGDLLGAVSDDWLNDNHRGQIATILQTVDHTSDDFLDKIIDTGLDKKRALQLRQALQLGDMTSMHIPIVGALWPLVENDVTGKVDDLASLRTGQWLELAFKHGVPPNSYITPNQYAENLELAVEAKIPTAVLRTKLENKSLVFSSQRFSGIEAFLKKHKTFDLTKDDIDQFVEDKSIDIETAAAAKALQHLKRLDTRWTEVEILVNTGVDTAEKITNYDKAQFKTILGDYIFEERLEVIYNRASALKGASIGLLGYLQPLLFGVSAQVTGPSNSLKSSKTQIEGSPTLRKLFGAIDNCHCDPCLSVLSPSAYLTDLLKFVDASIPASLELQRRRPDIYDLDLSCDNSKIELPQIDLAIEILENAVVLPISVSLPVGTDINLELSNGIAVGEVVSNALKTTAIDDLDALIANKINTIGTIYNNGEDHWTVKDKYRTWTIESFEERFGFAGQIFTQLDISKVVSLDPVSELNYGNIPEGIEEDVATALENGVKIKLPLTAEITEIKVLNPSSTKSLKRWEISFKAEGYIYIDFANNSLISNDTYDSKFVTKQATPALLNHIKNDLNNRVISSTLIGLLNDVIIGKDYNVGGFRVIKQVNEEEPGADIDLWKFIYTGKRILEYRPAAINIIGLTYQSTEGRDLFARAQNRNPLAYEVLRNDAIFPWSLPYDYNLAETREALLVSGVPRLSLMEVATNSAHHFNSRSIAQERLGLSPSEWSLIINSSVELDGRAKTEFWRIWGISNAVQTLRDTFIDSDIIATPFGENGLLPRISIILQQARLHFSDLEALLETRFINSAAINILSSEGCQPSVMKLSVVNENILAPFLDRLHRFVRLWRITGWKVSELDLAIQATGIGNNQLTENTLIQIANLRLLQTKLQLPIEVLVAMLGGFSDKHYSQIINDETKSIIPLYDRLFQNRQLIDPPVAMLAFAAQLSEQGLTNTFKETLAGTIGIRTSDLQYLLNTNSIDIQNKPTLDGRSDIKNKWLQWIFRHVRLAKTLQLPLSNYQIVWRLLPGNHFASSGDLLKFIHQIDFVNKSGFTWSDLEYILLHSDTGSSTPTLSNQHAVEILDSLQRQLEQLNVPVLIPTLINSPLTDSDLKTPPFPAPPENSHDRFKKHWKLERGTGDEWSVQDPINPQKKLGGTGIALLSRIDVLAQQKQLHSTTIIGALETEFVAGTKRLEFTNVDGNPVSILNLTEDHLDQLEIFLFLLQTSKLPVQELELLLKAFAPERNLDKLVEYTSSALQLQERLHLQFNTIVGWWINDPDNDRLAETIGVSIPALGRLLTIFRAETGNDAWTSPSTLIEFMDASTSIKQRTDLVIQHLAQALLMEPELVATCLWEYLHTSDSTPKLAMQHLISGNFRGLIPDSTNATIPQNQLVGSDEYAILVRLHKIGLLLAGWKATSEQLGWINQKRTGALLGFTGLIFDLLPIQTPSSSAQVEVLFTAWKRSTALYSMAHSGNSAVQLLTNYHEALTALPGNDRLRSVREVLTNSLTLSSNIITFCFNRLEITTIEQYQDPLLLVELIGLLGTVQRLGIDHENLDRLLAASSSTDTSELSRKLLRTRFGESGWPGALRKMTDQLRIQQRDRLVDYLLAKESLHDANALYAHYMIDVEMSPCMNTTRMLQSTAAVQLFVHRCLFNLEKEVSPASISKKRWEWMQNYRVWEANRRIFLYPENWLFPEVRDDRTEAFKAFESALTQSEPRFENAVAAVEEYVSEVGILSTISVVGIWHEPSGNGSPSVTYVIGKSNSNPSFYWRTAKNFGGDNMSWTGWKKVDASINSNFVLPVMFKGLLHLIWFEISTSGTDPLRNFDVGIRCSYLSASGWRTTSSNSTPFKFTALAGKSADSSFVFRVVPNINVYNPASLLSSEIIIECYCAQDTPRIAPSPKLTSIDHFFGRSPNANADINISGEVWHGPDDNSPIEPKAGYRIALTVIEHTSPDSLGRVSHYLQTPLYQVTTSTGGFNFSLTADSATSDRFFEVTFRVIVQNSDGDTIKYSDFRMDPANSYTNAHIRFVILGEISAAPLDSERPILMKKNGDFRIPANYEIVYTPIGTTSNNFNKQVATPVTMHKNAYRESLPSNESLNVYSAEVDTQVFGNTPGQYLAISSHDDRRSSPNLPSIWYYEDLVGKLFFTISKSGSKRYLNVYSASMRFFSMLSQNIRTNIENSFSLSVQEGSELSISSLNRRRIGSSLTLGQSLINEGPSFTPNHPSSIYSWEFFYHLPIHIATFLSRQHRFEDARKWFHFIFDPTTNDSSTTRERFWQFAPFRTPQLPNTITQLLEALANPLSFKGVVKNQIAAWLEDPFNPFAVARMRNSAFEWYTVIAYIKNLTSWADQLYRRDTRESINEATLLYIMGAQILGPRPEKIRTEPATYKKTLSYRSLRGKPESDSEFGNVWQSLADTPYGQSLYDDINALYDRGVYDPHKESEFAHLSSIGSLYFCVPPNEKLSELWEMVEDRLFKIRHCQNIEGINRSLPLYEPPIDPELLIRAKALGLDIADVLADLSAPLPHYRFQVLLQKANEFCNEVKGLGSAILSAIEKKESEHLALLRSSQEIGILKLIETVKEEQIKEAQANIESLQKTRSNARDRLVYLQRQLGQNKITLDASGVPIVEQSLMLQVQETAVPNDFRSLSLIRSEIDQVLRLKEGHDWSIAAGVTKVGAGAFHALGATPYGVGWATAVAHGMSAVGDSFGLMATNASFWEKRGGLIAGWQRRRDEWVQQSKMTAEEIRQIDKQILALEIRKSIASKELHNHQTQIDNARNIDGYMRQMKFSGESLYGWMESQLAELYFSAYQLAYDLAKRTERSYRHEIGDPSSSFIEYGYWDNLHKGLLTGERLSQDLRRMESAYLNYNRRELEVVKHVSLRQLDPIALVLLRDKGFCEFEIPEALFDMDFPGHFFRRIKSVSVSVPCVVGPYNSVSGTLTLLSSKLRGNYLVKGGGYAASENYQASYLPIQSIATSSGQNDSGLFELNFRDERYLPFEGAGAISRWRLTLPEEIRQFNYDTISDVIMHVKYTSREGGSSLKSSATGTLREHLSQIKQQLGEEGLHIVVNLKHDMPNEWNLLKQNGKTKIQIDKSRLPYFAQSSTPTISAMLKSEASVSVAIIKGEALPFSPLGDSGFLKAEISNVSLDTSFALSGDTTALSELKDLILIVKFTVPPATA